MSAAVSLSVSGLRGLADALRNFDNRVSSRGLRAANYAAARVIGGAIKETAPVRTGLLKANVIVTRKQSSDLVIRHAVVVRKNPRVTLVARRARNFKNALRGRLGKYHALAGPGVYGRFVEFGTSRMAARPFARPAVTANAQNAVDALKERLAKACADAAR